MSALPAAAPAVEDISAADLVHYSAAASRRPYRAMKRTIDIAGSLMLLLFLLPMLLIVASLVRFDTPGPVLYRARRYGQGGVPFDMLKFRSMAVARATDDQAFRSQVSQDGVLAKSSADPRLTRVGRVIREFSLDELPQLLNVLRGEMSLVGPRPHALEMRTEDRLGHEIIAEYAQRHRVRPGLTGLAQVRGLRGATHTAAQLRARVECDLDYIERWSFLLDLRILAMTAVKVFSSAGAF